MEAVMLLQDQSSSWMGEFYFRYVIALLTQLPLFLVYLGGFAVALIGREKHPKVSLMIILAMVILLFNSWVMTGIQLWLPHYWISNANSPGELRTLMEVVGVIRNLLTATGLGLLLLAVFTGRSPNPEPVKPVRP
jgi:hypothetical protein